MDPFRDLSRGYFWGNAFLPGRSQLPVAIRPQRNGEPYWEYVARDPEVARGGFSMIRPKPIPPQTFKLEFTTYPPRSNDSYDLQHQVKTHQPANPLTVSRSSNESNSSKINGSSAPNLQATVAEDGDGEEGFPVVHAQPAEALRSSDRIRFCAIVTDLDDEKGHSGANAIRIARQDGTDVPGTDQDEISKAHKGRETVESGDNGYYGAAPIEPCYEDENSVFGAESTDIAIVFSPGLAITVNGIDKPDGNQKPSFKPSKTGEELAKIIDWGRPSWDQHSDCFPAAPGGVFYTTQEQREDFIKNIDDGAPLEYCCKCKKYHIIPGAPMHLGERDTCLGQLPKSFFKYGDHAWDAYIYFINKYVRHSEMEEGYGHKPNPDKKEFDMEYHERDRKWFKAGHPRGEGWWKCRNGPDASMAERMCSKCHTDRGGGNSNAFHVHQSVAQKKAELEAAMARDLALQGAKHKARVLAEIRREGYPQHHGPLQAWNILNDPRSTRGVTRRVISLSLKEPFPHLG